MGFETGIGASIDGVTCVEKFWILEDNQAAAGFCSSGNSGEFADAGNWDWVVVAHCFGAEPTLLPGQTGTFSGVTRGGSGKTGTMIVTGVRILWEVEPANLLHHFLYLGGNGQLSGGGSSSDSGTPAPVSARGVGMTVDAADAAIRGAELHIENLPAVYNDTSTAGYTKRDVGNYRCRFRYDAYFATFTEPPSTGDFITLAFNTDRTGSRHWDVSYGLVEGAHSQLVPGSDPNGHAVGNSVQCSGLWTQVNQAGATGVITAPGGTSIWPPA